jgi:hypothetical protein
MSEHTEHVSARRVEEQVSDLAPSSAAHQAMIHVASSRAAQEVHAAMMIAKRFPRDQIAAEQRILTACRRPTLAEQAEFSYPRGGQTVEAPSIRLAEVLAQNWGNMESGVIEIERRPGESTAMSYCWDLETNTRDVKVFQIRHIRDTRQGPKPLTDERDIYEMIANAGARRKRACILAVIPGDIVDAARAECNKTLKGANKEPLVDRIRKMTGAFADLSVTVDMLEGRLRHKLETCSEAELIGLRKIYQSLKDSMSSREEWFAVAAPRQEADLAADLLKNKPAPTAPPVQPAPGTPPQGATQAPQTAPSTPRPVSDAEVADYPSFHQAFEQWVAGDWQPEEMSKALQALRLAMPIAGDGPKSITARREVLEALRSGKLSREGVIAK